MNILVWDVESQVQNAFIEQVSNFVIFEAVESQDELVELACTEFSFVLFDLEYDKKSIDKLIKTIRKASENCTIICLSNSLTSKELAKHQNSKSGADIYFKTPIDLEVFKVVMEDFSGEIIDLTVSDLVTNDKKDSDHLILDSQLNPEEKKFVEEVVSSYSEESTDKERLNELGDKIQSSFNQVFQDKDEATDQLEKINQLELDEDDISSKFEFGELELDEDEYELIEGEDELIEDKEEYELIEDDSLEVGTDPHELGLQLDEIEVVEEEMENLEGVLDLTSQELDLTSLDSSGNVKEISQISSEVAKSDFQQGDDLPDLSLKSSTDELELDDAVSDLELGDDAIDLTLEGSSDETKDNLDSGFELGDDLELSVNEEISMNNEDQDVDLMGEVESQDEGLSMENDKELDLELGDDLELRHEESFIEASTSPEMDFDLDLEQPEEISETIDTPKVEESFDEIEVSKEAQEPEETDFNAQEISYNEASDLNDSSDVDQLNDDVDLTSESVKAKLAEIDSMMEDEHPSVNDNEDDFIEEDDDLFSTPSDVINLENDEVIATQVASGFNPDGQEKDKSQILQDYQELSSLHSLELEKLGETIKILREDREKLTRKVYELEQLKGSEVQEILDLKSILDEKSIEITVIKKRFEKQVDELKLELSISLEKRDILEHKNKELERELENMSKKVKVDVTHVRAREKELETKLDLLKNDTYIQIQNRDQIITELRRKVDTLEFDLEVLHGREKKNLVSKHEQQDKVTKVIEKLKVAIGELEDDPHSVSILQDIKKNLDV